MSIEERAEELDSHGMLEAAFNLPDQMEWALGRDVYIDPFEVSNIVIAGMGGSAIGGDIVKACTASTLEVPLEPWRGFNLPAYVGKGTLLVAVSYSGNTRETLSMLEYGIARGATVVGISSGGRMTDMMEDLGLPCIVIPKAPAPRAAIGYLTVPIFRILETLGLVTISPDLRRAVERLREVATLYRPDYDNGNLPLEIATLLAGKFPVIYAPDAYAPAARRWMTQLNEVSKVLAHWGTIPEIAHNEIVGWDVGPGGNEHVILLDGDLSGDLEVFFGFFRELFDRHGIGHSTVPAEPLGGAPGIFHHIMVGDLASTYLAFLRNLDPFTIEAIDELKARQARG